MKGKFTDFAVKKNAGPSDTMRIKGSRIAGTMNGLGFRDADTGQFICYLPSVDISGYGETEEKAIEMAKFSLSEYFSYLMTLSVKKRDSLLFSLGWKHERMKNKEYSKAFVDGGGQLQDFNAVEGKVERLTLSTV